MEQQYYTSSQRRMDGQAGFGVKAQSSGLTADDAAALGPYNRYHKPLTVPDEAIDQAPVSLSFTRLPSGRYGISQSAYVGRDYSGRWGNFFVHSLVCDLVELAPVYYAPISLLGQPLWATREEDAEAEPGPLLQLPRIGPVTTGHISGFFSADPRRGAYVPAILQGVLEREQTGRRVVIVDEPASVACWIFAVYAALPASCRPALAFSTYQRDPSAVDVDVVGLYPGESDALLAGTARFQLAVFDPRTGTAPSDIVPGLAARRMGELVVRGDDASLQQLHDLAERLGIDSLAELEAVVAVDSLRAGDPAAVNPRVVDAVAAFLGRPGHKSPGAVADAALDVLAVADDRFGDEGFVTLVGATHQACAASGQESAHDDLMVMKAVSALGDATVRWPAVLGLTPQLEATRRAIAAQLPPDAWTTALVGPSSTSSRTAALWWIVDEAVAAGARPNDEAFWIPVADGAASSGDRDAAFRILGTVGGLVRLDPPAAGIVLDSIGDKLLALAPDETLTTALSLMTTETAGVGVDPQEDLQRCSDFMIGAFSSARLKSVLSATAADPEGILLVARDVLRRRPNDSGALIDAISGIGGSAGERVRAALSTAPELSTLREGILTRDVAVKAPAQALLSWLGPMRGPLNEAQARLVDDVLARVLLRPTNEADVESMLRVIGRANASAKTRQSLAVAHIAVGPLAPISGDDWADARNALDQLGPSAGNTRLILRRNLTFLDEMLRGRQAAWQRFAAIVAIPASLPVAAPEYSAYLRAAFAVTARARLRPPTVGDVYDGFGPLMRDEGVDALCSALAAFLADAATRSGDDLSADAARGLVWLLSRDPLGLSEAARVEVARGLMKVLPRGMRGAATKFLRDDVSIPRATPAQADFITKVVEPQGWRSTLRRGDR